ncbi:hypothetical protein [Cytobacillus pseudoceanisediminis]
MENLWTIWAFDCEGAMIKSSFDSEVEAEDWATNHGLEILKIEKGAE